MESTNLGLKMLSKFSNAKWILSYYKPFHECESLMTQLSTKTKECWDSHREAFKNALTSQRKKLRYIKPFNDLIKDYLLENRNYQKYSLNLEVSDKTSYVCLLEFLRSVEDLSNLKIDRIRCGGSGGDKARYGCNIFYYLKIGIC